MARRWWFAAVAALWLGCPKNPEDTVDPKIRADGHYVASQAAYLKGDFAEAHKQLEEAKKLNPVDPRLNAAFGELLLSEGKLDDAKAAFEAAAAADPKRATTWSRLGSLYSLKGDRAKAKEALDKALAQNPKDFNAHEVLGELFAKQGDAAQASEHWLLAAEFAPKAGQGELVLKAVELLKKQPGDAGVLEVLERAVAKGVDAAEVYTELGDQLAARKQLGDAEAQYVKAAKADPKDPTLWEIVGEIQAAQGRDADAEASFRSSLAVENRGVVHVALARACQRRKDDACLKVELDQALQVASGAEAREVIELASLLASVGRKADALALFKTMASEPDAAKDLRVQLETARLAKDLKDAATLAQACARVTALEPGSKCPR